MQQDKTHSTESQIVNTFVVLSGSWTSKSTILLHLVNKSSPIGVLTVGVPLLICLAMNHVPDMYTLKSMKENVSKRGPLRIDSKTLRRMKPCLRALNP